jgi:Domain of unknown function (DUF4365)
MKAEPAKKMTKDQQKEALSREFLRILANGHGFKVIEPPQDHGVDMIVCPVTTRQEQNGRVRYLDSQFKLEFQLKATTPAGVVDSDEDVKFDLDVKNYNDLVQRRAEPLPLHLLVIVLQSSPPNCIVVTPEHVGVLGQAYWYLPAEGAPLSSNVSQVRITIPKANLVNAEFVRERYEDLGIEL